MAEYIEREKALKAFDNPVWRAWSKGVPINRIINKIPAADVEPVRHGRWDGGTCTHCKLPWDYNMVQNADDWGYMDPMPNFCPNCGAKMDGEAP